VVIDVSCNDSICAAAESGALVKHSAKAFFTIAFWPALRLVASIVALNPV
jgi:hypothetical protein